ncbi:MAG: protein-glutamate O-methyltransferase CheR, partial [Alphaproteobacteria bacterium]|nr:protein-glutamate O-methyltransferase CheR [Alphaproteobacteria bacterium]
MDGAEPEGKDWEDVEIGILLEGIRRRYGYDFRHYSPASLKRRLYHMRGRAGFSHYTEVLDAVFHDECFFDQFLKHMSITVTDMFRDPLFYKAMREKIIPALKTFPY